MQGTKYKLEQASNKKFIFYNYKNKKILIITGKIFVDEKIAIIFLKPHMSIYGITKVECLNDDGSKTEYKVIGYDKYKNILNKYKFIRPYIIYFK